VSGFTFVADDSGHVASPKPGSYFREIDGEPADLLAEVDYPVAAVCARCDRPIRLAYRLQWDWRHAPARVTGGAS
jgi:hypothetical protein